MESAVGNKKLILREVTPVALLDDLARGNAWQIDIDQQIQKITADGEPADSIFWNETLRSLVWTNRSAQGTSIISGSLSFERDFSSCHGRVTTGEGNMYLVESVNEHGMGACCTNTSGIQPFDLLNLGLIDPPTYESIQAKPIPKSKLYRMMASPSVDSKTMTMAPDTMLFAATTPAAGTEGPSSSTIQLLTYRTEKRAKTDTNDEDWEPFPTLGIGSEYSTMLHPVIFFGTDEITSFVHIDQDSNHYVKGPKKAGDPVSYSFDITFTGHAQDRSFTGTLVNAKGREFEWKGNFATLTPVSREGSNQRVLGSDGLSLDQLLQGVTSMSRNHVVDADGKKQLVDLAQKEADRVFGRLVLGSVGDEVSNMLFPGVFNLTPAETKIQNLGLEFLKRAGIHSVLANIKASDNVKAKTKDKINKVRCERFLPMCVSAGAAPNDPANDPVQLYGLDREKDKDLVNLLQSQAQTVSRACYLLGYRTAVFSMQAYLNNAGEWYGILASVLTSPVYLADWKNRASGSEGMAKTLYDIHTKLDLLWEAANAEESLKAKLPKGVKSPTEVISILNAAGLDAALDSIEFDDTARQNISNFFEHLDELEKDKRTQALAEHYRKQMIADDAKRMSFSEMGKYIIKTMEELRQNKKWSIREASGQAALLDAADMRKQAGDKAPAWYKNIKWKDGFMSYFRSAMTVAAMSGLVYLFSQNAGKMDWADQLSLFGQLAEGFVGVRGAMTKIARSGAMSIGSFLNKWFLAPLAKVCDCVGRWLYSRMSTIGKALIEGIKGLVTKITNAIKTGAEIVVNKVGEMGTWLKNTPIQWGQRFQTLARGARFGLSALCFWVATHHCMKAFKDGRTIDKVTSTIGAALAGLEVLCLVIEGIATLIPGAGMVVSVCAALGPILAAAGIVFAVAMVIVAFVYEEDPLDNLVVKYGKMYDILT